MTEMLVELVLCPVTFTGAAEGSDGNNNLLTVSIIGGKRHKGHPLQRVSFASPSARRYIGVSLKLEITKHLLLTVTPA